MIKKSFAVVLALFCFATFFSCEKEIDERASDELLRLKAFMSIHYPNVEPTKSGLYIIITEQGTGAVPQKDNYLIYDYAEKNLDDEVFKTSIKSTAMLHDNFIARMRYAPKLIKYQDQFSPMLEGVTEGFTHLKEGAKAILIMPSTLAYGSAPYKHGQATVNPFSSIIVEIDFKKIVTDPAAYEEELTRNFLTSNFPELNVEDVITSLNADSVYIISQEEKVIEDDDEEEDGDEEEVSPYLPINDDDEVTVYYAGRLTDNWLFDTNMKDVAQENGTYVASNAYEPIKVKIGSTTYIKGFSLSLKKLKTNTKAKVLIKSAAAYGENGSKDASGIETIPPHAPLIFDLDITTKVAASSKP